MGGAIFDYSIRFLDTGGHPAALTKEGRKILLGEEPGFVVQNGRGIHLKPGQSSSEDLELQRYFDIKAPGKYKLLVQRRFTQPSEAVSSNELEIGME